MKPLGRKNYGSIPHLSTSKLGLNDHYITHGQEKILVNKTRDDHDKVLVFEKYDGSNVGVTKVNNKIIALTRSGHTADTSPYLQHHEFADWVDKYQLFFDRILKNGERVAGEWLYQAHGMRYTIKGSPVVFFDYFSKDNERYTFDVLKKTGLQLPRLLHEGGAISPNELISKLNNYDHRIKAVGNPEGIIYRVERKGKVDFLAKWVRSDFVAGKYIINKEAHELIYNEISTR